MSQKGKEMQAGGYAGLDSSPIDTDFSRTIPLQLTQAFLLLSFQFGRE